MTISTGNHGGGRKLAPLTRHATLSDERKAISGRLSPETTLTALASELGVNRGYLSAVYNGKRRASNKLRCALGLPPRFVAVAPCAHCGEAHIRKSCPKRKAEGKPRPARVRYSESAVGALVAAYQRAVLGVLLGGR